MNHSNLSQVLRLHKIVQSFFSEGYTYKVNSPNFGYIKLQHMRNQNIIDIKFNEEKILVFKNKKLIKHETCH